MELARAIDARSRREIDTAFIVVLINKASRVHGTLSFKTWHRGRFFLHWKGL
jgi:hypothetical protein